ncbi:MAG: polysaccharide pyruvyl transferase family protein [Phycisphaeraceae bacterium]|nr:polysaccharide pyruvyl transferase family protein [Phycisphaeraceae bacterium]
MTAPSPLTEIRTPGEQSEGDSQRHVRVLMLNDRFASRHRLFNLGDRALQDGIHWLVLRSRSVNLLPSEWKTFPYLTIKRYRAARRNSTADDVFKQWSLSFFTDHSRGAGFQSTIEQWTRKSALFNNPIMRRIDDWTQYRTSLGLMEALRPYLLRRHYRQRLIDRITAAELVVFNGSGLISDHLGHYMPGWLLELYLAKTLGKPVITCNQTIGIHDPELRDMVGTVYRMLDLHITREPESVEVLRELGVPEDRIMTSIDSAFAADLSVPLPSAEIANDYGIDDKTILMILRGDRSHQIDAIRAYVRGLSDQGFKPLFAFTCDAQDRPLYQKVGGGALAPALDRMVDFPLLVAMMRHARLVVTDRYHAAIFATMAGTPFVPMPSSTLKMVGLVRLLDYPMNVLPPLRMESLSEYLNTTRTLADDRVSLGAGLLATAEQLRNRAFSDYRILAHWGRRPLTGGSKEENPDG